MKCVTRCLLTLAAALVLAPPTTLRAADAPTKQPNIVFIYTDDQPQRALGSVDPYFSTPHMDRLAKESVVFNHSFVTTAICAVSRASFFTGQHSGRNGIASFDTPLSTAQMKQSYAGRLRQAGYPYEFSVPVPAGETRFTFKTSGIKADGTTFQTTPRSIGVSP